ncbi:TetR/AcrR family transcriptional regulator [Microbacterium foliorum]|uniref:Bacterial regulatory protein, tetR family n=1 Tax=Microbacterium foliorum TaxID=104336 RepID=A0A0F0KJD1_9MICO|nr:TetR/AcrR family transcriptional regulator [Microbacterium foliorum]AXL10998.1 TetR/AcrR family transcriptional regulator [Microbacterium foliorum]KJL20235.1 Bacterial regulatory protein, tetR family [Microbacterium foliorum]
MARERTRTKVHAAALSLAGERPVAAITMEGIAARAGVSKQTLYRSWSSTGEILFDALLARSLDENGRVTVPNSGDLAVDLTALATGMIDELADPTQERLLRALTAELQSDDALAAQFRAALLEPQLSGISERLRQASVPAPEDVAELFVGPIFHRWLLRSRSFDAEWVAAHVERVLRSAGAR